MTNWLSGASLPSAGYYAKLEEAFFGTNPDYEGWKLELREAFLREREAGQRSRADTSKNTPAADGGRAPPADGGLVANVDQKLDERGRVIEEAYFGSDGRPILNQNRVARVAWKLDAHGRVTEEAYFGIDGEPVLGLKEGVARTVSEHDPSGRLIARSYFGIDGRPMMGPLGAERIQWQFNEKGIALEETRYFVNDDPSKENGLLQWRSLRVWKQIAGKWKFGVDGSATFLKPQANQPPYGICLSDVAFDEGDVKAIVTPRNEINGRVVLGYRAQDEDYLAVGIGGWGNAYTLTHYTQTKGWDPLFGVGHEDDIEPGASYELRIQVRGRKVSLSSNGQFVFEFELPFPVRCAPLGLFAWGDKGYNIDFTGVAIRPLT